MPDKLIIHSMYQFFEHEGKLLHASDFLTEKRLSAHFLIKPNGEVIKQQKTTLQAWHAKGFNFNSIGIECLVPWEGTYSKFIDRIKTDWVTTDQMNALMELSNGIIEHYDITHDNVLRHSDISPERKVDPGSGFEWNYFKSQLI